MRTWVKWVLFGSSYTPFFLILLLRETQWSRDLPHFRLPWFAGVLVAVILISNGILVYLMRRASKINADCTGSIETTRSRSGESLNYIATYIIPFLAFETPEDLLSLLVLMIVVGTLYVSSDLFYTNPMLAVAGYQVYEVTLKGQGDPLVLISDSRPRPDQLLCAALLAERNDVYLDVREGGGK